MSVVVSEVILVLIIYGIKIACRDRLVGGNNVPRLVDEGKSSPRPDPRLVYRKSEVYSVGCGHSSLSDAMINHIWISASQVGEVW